MRIVLFSRVPRWYSFRGDRLVTRLVREGHEVVGVVVERVPTLVSFREWMMKLGPGLCLTKAVTKILRLLGLKKAPVSGVPSGDSAGASRRQPSPPVHVVESHNSSTCVEVVKALKPDVIILRGCGIIKWPILEIPKLGTINPHYAELPTYRGMDVTEWAALHGDPVAVSVHFVAEGVDTGAILAHRRVPVERGDTVGGLRDKSAAIAVELFVEVLAKLKAGTSVPRTQPMTEGKQYFTMHPRLRRLANERLRRIA
jgi:folate-dependent phosphoribosylglycinamide formyltransferase PurN